MTKEEFVRERADLVIAELTGHYGVQRDEDGTRFVYSPMEELDNFISSFDNDIDSGLEMYDEDEFDDEDSPFPEDVYQECLEEITNTYNAVVEARKPYELDE